MSRHSRSSNSVTLFPFLAVLVCAMGALIFLLLVTTRHIRSDTLARTQAAAQPSVNQPLEPGSVAEQPRPRPSIAEQPAPQPELLRVAGAMPLPAVDLPDLPIVAPETPTVIQPDTTQQALQSIRAQLKDDKRQLTDSRTALQTVLEQIAASQTQIGALKQATALTEKQNTESGTQRKSLQNAIEDLKRRNQQLERRIQIKKTRVGDTENRFAFVAYDGKEGTFRRPILIECTNTGFHFLSEDIRLGEEDFDGFITTVNPLLAGARALLKHLATESQSTTDNVAPEPYILLLVRPNGIMGYYAARRMLSQIGTDFGYELLEAEAKISVPDSSPEAVRICRQAIDGLLAQRDSVARAASPHARPLMPRSRPPQGQRTLKFTRNGTVQIASPDRSLPPTGNRSGNRTGGGSPQQSSGNGTAFQNSTDGLGRGRGNYPTAPETSGRVTKADVANATTSSGVGDSQGPGLSNRLINPSLAGPPNRTGVPQPQLQNAFTRSGSGNGMNSRNTTNSQTFRESTSIPQDNQAQLPRLQRRQMTQLRGANPLSPTTIGSQPFAGSSATGSRPGSPTQGNAARAGFPNQPGVPADEQSTGEPGFSSGQGLSTASNRGQNTTGPASANRSQIASGITNRQSPTHGSGKGQATNSANMQRAGTAAPGANSGSQKQQLTSNEGSRQAAARRGVGAGTGQRASTAERSGSPATSNGSSSRIGGSPPPNNGAGTSNRAESGRRSTAGHGSTTTGSGQSAGRGSNSTNAATAGIGGGLSRQSTRRRSARRYPHKRSWGLLGRNPSIGFERTVTINVTAQTIQVGNSRVISGRLERESLVHFVVDAIDRHARSWGPPPDSFYWVPSVQFQVGPDGQNNLNILKTELSKYGLPLRIRNQPTQRKPAANTPP